MTLIMPARKKCALCGKVREYQYLASTNAYGSPDLDTRPRGAMRGTMAFWVEECRFCRYVSPSIDELAYDEADISAVKAVVSAESYQKTDGLRLKGEYTRRFYRQHLLAKAFGDNKTAFLALLRAAWCGDDARDRETSVLCRKASLEFLDRLIAEEPENERRHLIRADILRRAGEFDAVVEQYQNKRFSDEWVDGCIRFEVEKARQKDAGRYSEEDAEEA